MSDDRMVHAADRDVAVVRYDKAGKWYIEPRDGLKRRPVGVYEAAQEALRIRERGGAIYKGLTGGAMFDRMVDGRA